MYALQSLFTPLPPSLSHSLTSTCRCSAQAEIPEKFQAEVLALIISAAKDQVRSIAKKSCDFIVFCLSICPPVGWSKLFPYHLTPLLIESLFLLHLFITFVRYSPTGAQYPYKGCSGSRCGVPVHRRGNRQVCNLSVRVCLRVSYDDVIKFITL